MVPYVSGISYKKMLEHLLSRLSIVMHILIAHDCPFLSITCLSFVVVCLFVICFGGIKKGGQPVIQMVCVVTKWSLLFLLEALSVVTQSSWSTLQLCKGAFFHATLLQSLCFFLPVLYIDRLC